MNYGDSFKSEYIYVKINQIEHFMCHFYMSIVTQDILKRGENVSSNSEGIEPKFVQVS